jgi:hypothetical protein
MTVRNKTDGSSGGNRRQSSVPVRSGQRAGQHGLRAGGVILRAVVTATYVPLDSPAAAPASLNGSPAAVYCDLIAYSSIEGYRGGPLAHVPVMQAGGLHDGHVWLPRAATVRVVAPHKLGESTMDPQDLDGDHVLVQFLEDDLSRPIITGMIPHPRLGLGNEDLPEVGHRMKLKLADGNPEFWKRNGSFFGFDKSGNFLVDTTRAHGGQFTQEGLETPANANTNGNVTIRANSKTTVRVVGVGTDGQNPKYEMTLKDNELFLKLQDGETMKLVGKDAGAVLTVGDGARHAVNFENLDAWWEAMRVLLTAFDVHVHATPSGPSGPPVPVVAAPSLPVNVKSTHILMPDG